MNTKLLLGGNGRNKTITKSIGVNSFINSVKFYYNEKNIISKTLHEKLKQFQENHHRSKLIQRYLFVVFVGGLFFVYKFHLHIMSFLTKDNVYQISYYMQDQINYGYEVIKNQTPYWIPILTPILCGILFSFFSYMIVLLDSKIPGTYPPSPFSPKAKNKYRKQKSFSIDLSYMTALASGFVVAFLMLYCS